MLAPPLIRNKTNITTQCKTLNNNTCKGNKQLMKRVDEARDHIPHPTDQKDTERIKNVLLLKCNFGRLT